MLLSVFFHCICAFLCAVAVSNYPFVVCCQFCRLGRYLKACLVPSRSRSLGIFELIIKESGDEGSGGKGRKSEAPLSPFPSHHSPLALYARSHHPSLALLTCSRVPQSPLSPGKACGGGRSQSHVACRFPTEEPF